MDPVTREEQYLNAIAENDASGIPPVPYTREEMYLYAITTGDTSNLPDHPYTREEMYLDYIAKNGGGGGGDITVEELNVTENGTKTAPSGKAYSPVNVNVPNSYTAGDEGKVVNNGALVAQTAHAEVTQNGTVDTTLNNSVSVNVQEPVIPAPIKDVVFVDYDGEIVQEYTAQEFLALSALPANPSHTGLTAQGWNWTLADAKTYVQSHGCLCIGQNYKTSDGKTRIHIAVQPTTGLGEFTLRFIQSVKNGVSISWGDGTTTVASANANALGDYKHTYQSYGEYTIELECASGTTLTIAGNDDNWGAFVVNGNTLSYVSAFRVRAVELGANVIIGRAAFFRCDFLETISIPTSVQSFANNTFSCGARCVVVPDGVTSFPACTPRAQFIAFPKTLTSTGKITASQLRAFILPEWSANLSVGYYLNRVERVSIPGTYTTIGNASNTPGLSTCWWLKKFTVPASVTTLAQYALENLWNLQELHMLPTTPPSLANTTNALWRFPTSLVIYVPYSADHSILAAYQGATNWSTLASYMQEEPQ